MTFAADANALLSTTRAAIAWVRWYAAEPTCWCGYNKIACAVVVKFKARARSWRRILLFNGNGTLGMTGFRAWANDMTPSQSSCKLPLSSSSSSSSSSSCHFSSTKSLCVLVCCCSTIISSPDIVRDVVNGGGKTRDFVAGIGTFGDSASSDSLSLSSSNPFNERIWDDDDSGSGTATTGLILFIAFLLLFISAINNNNKSKKARLLRPPIRPILGLYGVDGQIIRPGSGVAAMRSVGKREMLIEFVTRFIVADTPVASDKAFNTGDIITVKVIGSAANERIIDCIIKTALAFTDPTTKPKTFMITTVVFDKLSIGQLLVFNARVERILVVVAGEEISRLRRRRRGVDETDGTFKVSSTVFTALALPKLFPAIFGDESVL